MFKKPDDSWRTLFSTAWEIDERSSAFDWIRVYAWGLRELKLFRSEGEARRTLLKVESRLWQDHWVRCVLGLIISLGFGVAIVRWGLPIASRRGWIGIGMTAVLWVVGGWCLFCAVIRGAIARDLRSKLALSAFNPDSSCHASADQGAP